MTTDGDTEARVPGSHVKPGFKMRRWEMMAMPIVPAVFAIVTLTDELSALSLLARGLAVWAIVDAVRAHKNFSRKWAEAVILAGSALALAGIVLGGQMELVMAVFLLSLLAIGLLEGWSLEVSRSGQAPGASEIDARAAARRS